MNLTGIRTEANTCEYASSAPEYGSRRDAMIPVSRDSANVGPTFWVKELNPFDPGLDLVRSQVFKGKGMREMIPINDN